VNCESLRENLDDYLDGALEPGRAAQAAAHVGECAACAERLAQARSLERALAALPVPHPAAGFETRVLRHARAAAGRSRPPRIVGAAFVAAFAASILTVIYTGLLVEAPRTEISAALPTIDMVVDTRRDVNLVFAANAAADDVSLVVALPAGVDLLGHEGRRQVRWRTELAQGNNILPLTLVASQPATGQLVARLRHGDREKIFRVHVNVRPG